MLCSWPALVAQSLRRYASKELKAMKMDYDLYELPHSQQAAAPIVLMHGMSSTPCYWQRIARHLAKSGARRVFTVVGRSYSQHPASENEMPGHMTADLVAFMEEQQLSSIVALGHSIGARGMMTLALKHPELIERAIFVDVSMGQVPRASVNTPMLFKLMLSVLPNVPPEFSESEARKLILPHLRKLVLRDEDTRNILSNLQKLPNGQFAWSANAKSIIKGWRNTKTRYERTLQGLRPFLGPSMLVVGRQSKFILPERIYALLKYFPEIQFEILDTGHKVHRDMPDKLVELVVNFTPALKSVY